MVIEVLVTQAQPKYSLLGAEVRTTLSQDRQHYSIRTEEAYAEWIKRFILFHGKRHPAQLAAAEVEAFLTDLAVARKVSASTQNWAKSAILFLYREVLQKELAWLDNVTVRRRRNGCLWC